MDIRDLPRRFLNLADDSTLTLAELALYLNVGKRTIFRLLRAGSIPAIRTDKGWLFDRATIEKWQVDQAAATQLKLATQWKQNMKSKTH